MEVMEILWTHDSLTFYGKRSNENVNDIRLKLHEYGLNRRCGIVPKHDFKVQEDFQQKKVSPGTKKQETSGSIH